MIKHNQHMIRIQNVWLNSQQIQLWKVENSVAQSCSVTLSPVDGNIVTRHVNVCDYGPGCGFNGFQLWLVMPSPNSWLLRPQGVPLETIMFHWHDVDLMHFEWILNAHYYLLHAIATKETSHFGVHQIVPMWTLRTM